MRYAATTLYVLSGVLVMTAVLRGQEATTPVLKQRLVTVAGELKVVQLDEGMLGSKFAVRLNNDVILKTNGDDESSRYYEFPVPKVLKHITKGIPPFDEVVVFQQNMWGNACNGGPIWFLGLKKNGSFDISNDIDFCGGKEPIIKEEPGKIIVIIPGGPPNRGKGYIPGETWVYQNGEAQQIKAQRKGKK
jgi:hypothetical protein